MGVYDTVIVNCPGCGDPAYFQSKSGPCALATYQLADAPADVMEDVNRHAPEKCDCGAIFEVDIEKRKPVRWGPLPDKLSDQ